MIVVGLIGFSTADTWVSSRIDVSLGDHAAKYLASKDGHPLADAVIAAKIHNWQDRKILSERTYLLFAPDGGRLAGRLDITPPPVGFSYVKFFGGGRKYRIGRALTRRTAEGGLLVIVQHSEAATALHALLPVIVLSISLVSVIIGVAATILFARLTAKRLAETQWAADAIAAGDLSRRIPTDRLDGMFEEQANSLNRMLDRMEELVRAQRLFSSNLAHDLRTPLTRLRGLLQQASTNEDVPRALERAERECVSIISVFDALLRLAEIETGSHPSSVAELSLRPLIEDAADTMEPVIVDHGGTLEVSRIDDVVIEGDADLINQLVINLLENVANHTPAGTQAKLTLERRAEEALITVCDDGPGLPAEDFARVVQPFERGSFASGRRGSGLGLAIAHAIARFHHGHLELADAGPGLRVEVRLPLSVAQDAINHGRLLTA